MAKKTEKHPCLHCRIMDFLRADGRFEEGADSSETVWRTVEVVAEMLSMYPSALAADATHCVVTQLPGMVERRIVARAGGKSEETQIGFGKGREGVKVMTLGELIEMLTGEKPEGEEKTEPAAPPHDTLH